MEFPETHMNADFLYINKYEILLNGMDPKDFVYFVLRPFMNLITSRGASTDPENPPN